MKLIDWSQVFDFVGRAGLAAIFVKAIPGKITGFSATVSHIASKGIPEPLATILLLCSIVILIIGTVLLVFSRETKVGASLLLIFLVPTTLIFHTFPPDRGLIINLTIIGALLLAITRPHLSNRMETSHQD